ncbi:hypothetical protein B0H13DRAFT_2243187 [Mycena leptocephala]|nr:hypothetical protein B0H13DRAFT_2243187 [Mycena leptocephala]
MPISFSVAPHTANSMELTHSFSAMEILATSCKAQHRYVEEILQCAFSAGAQVESSGRDSTAKIPNLYPDYHGNGFVNTVIDAYDQHRALVVRPDDVWLTILSQFNLFVNANAELLRANFVAHEGQRELIIWAEGNRYSLDFGSMSQQMVDLIEKNIVDPTLRQWVLPDFTTTRVVHSSLFSSLFRSLFSPFFSGRCGIPRVTLEGEKSDWVDILGRLEKLKEYGIETIAWYHLLHLVISRFVAAFDAPASQDNVEFWQKVAHLHRPFSGRSYYSGWINAFNAFDKNGRWIGNALDKTAMSEQAPELMTAGWFWATYGKHVRKDLIFDGTPYHRVGTNRVPPAYAEVDVKLDDNGEKIDCFMLAGMVGKRVSSSADPMLSSSGENDTVHPVPGWWICTKKQNVAWEGRIK